MNIRSEPALSAAAEPGVEEPRAVSVVVPAYNEEGGIAGVVEEIDAILKGAFPEYEIIVVDDSSTDKTLEVAGTLDYQSLQVVGHRRNRGYGAALKTGITRARHEFICITDADATYPNARIPDLLRSLCKLDADMVVGSRTGDNVVQSRVRAPAKWALTKLANYIVGEPIPDINSGLRLFRRRSVMRFFDVLPEGFSFTTTITVAMLTNGYGVHYVPIDYHPRIGRSKIRPIRDTLNFLQLILRMGLYFAPLKIFLPMGGLMIGAALLWGILTLTVAGRLADLSTLIIAMTGAQIAALGLLAELIRHRVRSPYEISPRERRRQ